MKENTLVTIIIPVYNSENYLSRCIESILNQTYTAFELILVNDGSKDNSGVICSTYSIKDKRIKVFHIDNHGPGYARNIGLKNATGKYIQFTDSDDTLPSDYIQKMILRMEHENADLVVCGSKILKNNIEIEKNTVGDLRSYHNNSLTELFVHLLEKGLAYSPCNKLYRYDFINDYKIYFGTEFNLGEDAIFNMSYIEKCKKISFEESVYYEYYQNGGSLVHRYFHNKFEIQMLLYRSLKNLLKEASSINTYNRMYLYYQYEFTFVFINYYLPESPINSLNRRKLMNAFMQDDIVQEIFKLPNDKSSLQKIIRLLVRMKNAAIMDMFLKAYKRRYLL